MEQRQHTYVPDYFVWHSVPLADVVIDDAFWAPRLQRNHERTIPAQYAQLQKMGHLKVLREGWIPGDEPVPHPFWDSDIAKWIEAASYSLATHPDPALDIQVEAVIALLAARQQSDGYLNTYFTLVRPGERWTDLRDAHELYCAGHLIEAGVAHYQATGKRTLLNVVRRLADHIDTVLGRSPGQKRGYCGHEEIELALVKLARATGEERYLRLAQYFVDERGQEPFYFDLEAQQRGTPGFFGASLPPAIVRRLRERTYNQTHTPVREQAEVVGHAVRAMYLYSAMADLAGDVGEATLLATCKRLWTHLTTRRLYVTGGIGAARDNEGFTHDYDLPNETAYCETCAAIGLVFWAHRMAQLERDARYADILERALYNGVISGVSLDGTRFFYDNPLASQGDKHRQEWFGVACCPPNLARLLAALGGYIYSANVGEVAVHLYIGSTVQVSTGATAITLRQETAYPWDGTVALTVEVEQPATFALLLRWPGWCREATLRVDGEPVDSENRVVNSYMRLDRTWRGGEHVQLNLAMPVERVYAHPCVVADAGLVALQRGPLVYCLEGADNLAALHTLSLPHETHVTASFDPDVLGGIAIMRANGLVADAENWGDRLYAAEPPALHPFPITAIPYYAWDNRQAGEMRIWLHEAMRKGQRI